MSGSPFFNHETGSSDSPTYTNDRFEIESVTTHQGGSDWTDQMADEQHNHEFSAQFMGGADGPAPSQDHRMVDQFAATEGNVRRPSQPPFLQYSSKAQGRSDGAGGIVDGGARQAPSSFLAVPRPTGSAGTTSNNASTTYTQWGFTFPKTWQEFEQRGIRYFGAYGANLGSLSRQPPPETARLVTPGDPEFPMTNISSPTWDNLQLRRIAFLPNSLSLASDVLTGETIYFLRQFGVSFDDMIARASDLEGLEWATHEKKLRQREDAYRQKYRCGWARNFRTTRGVGKLTHDTDTKLYGPDCLNEENYIFNVWWDLDVNSQSMWPRSNTSARHPLPAPHIDFQVRKLLKSEGLQVPGLAWLSIRYPSLSLPPAQSGNQVGVPATPSRGLAQQGKFPSSSSGRQDRGAAPNTRATQASGMPDPTTVINNELVFILGESMPQYPDFPIGWNGPSYGITGTRYWEVRDISLGQMTICSQIPPHVRPLMAQAREATDRWRGSNLSNRQVAHSLLPADPTHGGKGLGAQTSGHSLGNLAGRSQLDLSSDAQPSQIPYSVGNLSPFSRIRAPDKGQNDHLDPVERTNPPNVGEGMMPGRQTQVMDSNIGDMPSNPLSLAEQTSLNVRRPTVSMQDVFTQPGVSHSLRGQNSGMDYGKMQDPRVRHSIQESQAQPGPRGRVGSHYSDGQIDGRGLGFVDVGGSSNINDRAVANLYQEGYAAEIIGRVDGPANEGNGRSNPGLSHAGGSGKARGLSSIDGDRSYPTGSAQTNGPNRSDGAERLRISAVGGLPGESVEGFVDRFLWETYSLQQPEDDE